MEVVRRHLLQLEELRHLLGSAAGGAVDDGPSGHVRRQNRLQDLVNVGELLPAGGRKHHELEVRALRAPVEDGELDAELVPEVSGDVLDHIRLRGRGEAEHGRNRILPRLLADEAPHVAVVGTEVVPPSREAVGLVQHPGPDLALGECAAEGPVAQLLRRDEHHPRVAEPDPIQRVGPLGHRQEPVDGDARSDSVRLETRDLVRHERDEGRDHHREGARLVVAGEGRDLVAERLAGAGGEDPEDVLAGHRRLDDRLLHRATVVARRLGTETLEAEPAGQLPPGVVPFPAPCAAGIVAGGVPQPANQAPRLGKLVADPGRHDRVAAGHREPRQRVGERPATAGRLLPSRPRGRRVRHACPARRVLGMLIAEDVERRSSGFRVGGPGGRSQRREEGVEARPLAARRRQPVPPRRAEDPEARRTGGRGADRERHRARGGHRARGRSPAPA